MPTEPSPDAGGSVAHAPAAGDCALDGSDSYRLAEALEPTALRRAIAVRDWVFAEARASGDANALLAGLCERLNAAGIVVDRAFVASKALHPDYAAVGLIWTREDGVVRRTFPHAEGPGVSDSYARSPFHHVHLTGRPLVMWLPDAPDERFGVVPELKAAGYTHYLCLPMIFANRDENALAFVTRAPGGWNEGEIAFLRFVAPVVAATLEIIGAYRQLDHLLRVYLGDDPHRRVLAGEVRRGQVASIRSAILFIDMRGFTSISEGLEPPAIVDLLNTYFDCVVPAIERHGGEVLKYMGDGVLAVVREDGGGPAPAADAALRAAREALDELAACNAAGRFPVPVRAGAALHHGEAAYGNVGSGLRLDFTVIGRDVNLASRVGHLNRDLGEDLLVTEAFARAHGGAFVGVGSHPVQGIEAPVPVLRPA